MTADQAIQLFTQLLWKAVVVSAPLLLTVLGVGLAVSVLQVVTQIQEMSLTFIPKLLASVVVLAVGGPWMLSQLAGYAAELIRGIPRML